MFEVIPAIDIRGGRCVRLVQGDYSRETVFGEDPVAVAVAWQRAGATRLHVVDLDGARAGALADSRLLEELLRAVTLPVQVGGGIRSLETARFLVAAGAARVVVGTIALADPLLLEQMLAACGDERVVVALDARDGRVATDGWLRQSDVSALELAQRLAAIGVKRLLYTDIARDGTLQGPNVGAVQQLVAESKLAVIASGGVSRPEHVAALRHSGAEAVVIGRALYTGALSLEAARSAAEATLA